MVTIRCSRKIDKTTWIRYSVRQILSIFLEYQVGSLTAWNRVDEKIPGGTPRKIDKICLSFCPGWYSVVLTKIQYYSLYHYMDLVNFSYGNFHPSSSDS